MPTDRTSKASSVGTRRVYRLSLTVALTLAGAYALRIPLPYIAPIFALVLTASPAPPLPLRALFGLVLLVFFTTGAGLLLVPVLINYPAVGLIVVALGLFVSNDLSLNRGKAAVGTFLTVGLTLITAAGVGDFFAALTLAKTLIVGIGLAVLSQRIVYPFFPEDPAHGPPVPKAAPDTGTDAWLAARTTLIVYPTYLLGLVNPGLYLPLIMKAVSLGQQSSALAARDAGRQLLGSTLLGGCFSMLLWLGLKINPSLWMFFLWMMLFGLHFARKLYRQSDSKFPPSFWHNVTITTLILVGPAVADSANGKDVYKAFAVRMALFVVVTLYAWGAVVVLERLRAWPSRRSSVPALAPEMP